MCLAGCLTKMILMPLILVLLTAPLSKPGQSRWGNSVSSCTDITTSPQCFVLRLRNLNLLVSLVKSARVSLVKSARLSYFFACFVQASEGVQCVLQTLLLNCKDLLQDENQRMHFMFLRWVLNQIVIGSAHQGKALQGCGRVQGQSRKARRSEMSLHWR